MKLPLLIFVLISCASAAPPAKSPIPPAAVAVAATTTKPPPPPPPVVMPSVPGGRHCVFPFWWHDRWHHTCVRYNIKGEQWCSITANFTRDENWKRCDSHDEKRFHCAIPFTYAGSTHYNCLPMSLVDGPNTQQTFWCGLTQPAIAIVSWSGTNWAFCETANATTSDYLKAVGSRQNLAEARLAALAKIGSSRNAVKSDSAAVVAVAQVGGSSLDGGNSGGDDTGDGPGWGAGLVVSLGVACALMAVAVATTACTVHRKYFRGRYKRIDPLLTSDPMEKSSYGGVEAYHD